jgi:hypothetical protein
MKFPFFAPLFILRDYPFVIAFEKFEMHVRKILLLFEEISSPLSIACDYFLTLTLNPRVLVQSSFAPSFLHAS